MADHTRETARWTTLPGPTGPVTVIVSAAGLRRVLLDPAGEEPPEDAVPGTDERTSLVADRLASYLAGERRTFDLPLDWSLSRGFQRDVLRSLYDTVGYGETITYGELAARAGRPGAARVVGAVMGSNPIPIVVPCHRVVDSGGGLGGFSGSRRGPGMATKRRLLTLEGALAPTLFDA